MPDLLAGFLQASGHLGLLLDEVVFLGEVPRDVQQVVRSGERLAARFLAAAGAIILGMGMPIAPTYIMLVILIAPAMEQIGILPLAAHLFINFFGAMSFVTPPVCVAAFVAAGIAESSPMKVGFTAARLGIAAYVVPFAFCYSTGLLLQGSVAGIVWAVVPTTLGIVFLAIGLSGYLFTRFNCIVRGIFIVGGLMLLTPGTLWRTIGFMVPMVLILWDYWKRKTGDTPATEAERVEAPSN